MTVENVFITVIDAMVGNTAMIGVTNGIVVSLVLIVICKYRRHGSLLKNNIVNYIINKLYLLLNGNITAISSDSRPPKFEMLDINNCF